MIISFSRLFPIPSVEDFTVRRRNNQSVISTDPGLPWDEESLRKLEQQANLATLTMLDLCSSEETTAVLLKDIAESAGLTNNSVRAQLAGLTMRIKNPKAGFAQTTWPIAVEWLGDGRASYHMAEELAAMWRAIRAEAQEEE